MTPSHDDISKNSNIAACSCFLRQITVIADKFLKWQDLEIARVAFVDKELVHTRLDVAAIW